MLPLEAEQRERLGGPVVGAADPVRCAGVELDHLAGVEEVLGVVEDQPPPAVEAGRSSATRRRLLVHMLEETGRHAGHADILRERIDGRTGR